MFGNILRRPIRGVRKLLRDQKGMGLIEILVAVGILGAVGSVFVSAVFTGARTSNHLDEITIMNRIVQNQIEEIKNASYDVSAPYEYPIVDHPADYSISVDIEIVGENTRQDITITVQHEGSSSLTLDIFKVKGL
jgi:type II secretory pathway pseudopilin PulG